MIGFPRRGRRGADRPIQKIITRTSQGEGLGEGTGRDILDQPIHALLWLIKELNRSGTKLKPGDMISLGAVHQFKPLPGRTVFVTYSGLPGGTLRAMVGFE